MNQPLELHHDRNDESLWTAKQVAGYLNVPVNGVYEMDIPQVRLSPRRIRFDPADVRAWKDKRKAA